MVEGDVDDPTEGGPLAETRRKGVALRCNGGVDVTTCEVPTVCLPCGAQRMGHGTSDAVCCGTGKLSAEGSEPERAAGAGWDDIDGVVPGGDVIASSVEARRSDGLEDRVGVAPHIFGPLAERAGTGGVWGVVDDDDIIDDNAPCESDRLVDEMWDLSRCGKETTRTGGGGDDSTRLSESAGNARAVDGNMFNITRAEVGVSGDKLGDVFKLGNRWGNNQQAEEAG